MPIPDPDVIVWSLYLRLGMARYLYRGKGLVHSSPTRIDVLDPESGFQSIGSLLLPRQFMVPNGMRVLGVREEDLVAPIRPEVEWLLTKPMALALWQQHGRASEPVLRIAAEEG